MQDGGRNLSDSFVGGIAPVTQLLGGSQARRSEKSPKSSGEAGDYFVCLARLASLTLAPPPFSGMNSDLLEGAHNLRQSFKSNLQLAGHPFETLDRFERDAGRLSKFGLA